MKTETIQTPEGATELTIEKVVETARGNCTHHANGTILFDPPLKLVCRETIWGQKGDWFYILEGSTYQIVRIDQAHGKNPHVHLAKPDMLERGYPLNHFNVPANQG